MPKTEPQLLTPLPDDPEHIPGQYAAIDVSPYPIFGPDQLGDLVQGIEALTTSATRTDSSSRILEILQRWEARLFSRGYQFLTSTRTGMLMNGAGNNAGAAEVMALGNARKLFPVNVYAARQDKITAAGAREIPSIKFGPKDPAAAPDQTAADESDKYLKVWLLDSDIKGLVARIWRLFYTDDRVVLWTRSVADKQRWGTELPDDDTVFGAGETEGVTPETELQDDEGTASSMPDEMPAICEITTAHGVLESKVPIYADDVHEMGYVRLASEVDVDILKEKYPWIEDKIEAGQTVAGSSDQYDRMARVNVRLALQTTSASGETSIHDATETHTWYRPSKYRAITDKAQRQTMYDNFPDGLRVTHAGGALAFVRNESLDNHIEIIHSKDGDGQNRRSIGNNYLPLQKILNQNIGLLVRYFVGCVPRRFAAEGPLDVAAMNQQGSDTSIVTPVTLEPGQSIGDITGIERVPQPTTGLMEFVQWLVDGGPEAMDGATPTMFGNGDVGTVGESELNRDQSLQVYSAPWAQTCVGLAKCATQAARCAAENRKTNIRSRTPGQEKLTAELANMQGDALAYATSLEIPPTLAEQAEQTAEMFEKSANVPLYASILADPVNLPFFSQIPTLNGLNIPGLDAVEKQQGEFELLTSSGPMDNPQIAAIQEQIAQLQKALQEGQTDPEAQTPAGQALMQKITQQVAQLQQAVQQLPPKVSSVPVAQDGSENHAIEAAITLAKLTSPEGRKLKNGDPEQQGFFQNLKLHWQEHSAMLKKLTPVPLLIPKVSVTAALDKAPPAVQAQGWQAIGVTAEPADFVEQNSLVPHEVTTETEGIDPATGLPVKKKISEVNPGGKLD